MNVELVPKAQADLVAIGSYIAVDNPTRAESFVADILDTCATLADLPRAFPLVPRYEAHGVRRRNHGRYAIFYRIDGQVIQILHIVHGARDYMHILFPDG